MKTNHLIKGAMAAIALTGLLACGQGESKTFENYNTGAVEENKVTGKDSIPLPNMPDSAAARQAWTAFRLPGDMHAMMANDDGNWNEQITMWMEPGVPLQTVPASCTKNMILGGRYQQTVHKAVVMGMPFEGRSTLGYDNGTKKFIKSWVDNMGTGFMNMEGDYDAANKVVHLKGTQTDPITGKSMDVREDYTFNPDGSRLLERYGSQMAGSPEYKVLEIKLMKK